MAWLLAVLIFTHLSYSGVVNNLGIACEDLFGGNFGQLMLTVLTIRKVIMLNIFYNGDCLIWCHPQRWKC